MTKIVNLFGGPGSGKSTTATGVFSRLKQLDCNVEYVSEYAKDIVWEGTTELLNNQVHVFAEQFRRQWRLLGKVDYVITDSPILLSAVYFEHWFMQKKPDVFSMSYCQQTKNYFIATFNQFDNINWFIERHKTYNPAGRLQSEEEANQVAYKIRRYLEIENVGYRDTNSIDAINDVCARLLPDELMGQ